MRRIALRSVWEHKRRLASTVISVVLGVAFLSGTFVFSDTLNQALDDLFAQANEAIDARVQGEVIFESDFGDERAPLDESIVAQVSQVDGVAAAAPYVFTEGFGPSNRVLDKEGEPIGVDQGPPTLLESWIADDGVTTYRLTDGSRPPETDDEIALDVSAAEDGGFEIGDTVTVTSQFGNKDYTLVGTFTFGDSDSLGGVVAADFTLAEAQRLAGSEGQIDYVYAAAEEGLSQEELVERIERAVPPDTVVLTGEEATEQDADEVQSGLAFFNQVLTIFGGLALLVATFLIANTFQILLAQRTRELALLRAVGASRRQVLVSVLLEAFAVGLVAAVIGILAGIGLALGITALLDAVGVDLPTTTLVLSPNTVITGLLVGVLVTVLSSLAPAIRATRVPPLAALRDVAIERSGGSRIRLALGILAAVLGAFNLSQAWSADGDTDVVPTVGIGAVLAIVAAILVGPFLAGRSVRSLGVLLPRLRGITGRLAVENAARAPKRTASTASALVIAVVLVGFITVFAESAKASVESEVERGVTADLVVQPSGFGGGFAGFTPEVTRTVSEVDGVAAVSSFAASQAQITYPDGDTAVTFVGAVDPRSLSEMIQPRMEQGEFVDLAPGGVLVDRQIAEDHDLEVGTPIGVLVTGGGQLDLQVAGISDDPTMLGLWTIHVEDYEQVVDQRLDFQVFATVEDGASLGAVQADITDALEPFPGLEVLDRDGFVGDLADQLSAFVNVIYGLLALSIFIAMFGVANTLSLSVHERTRELGLLRAVGMARAQLRSAIRWEAVLIAVLGTVVGLALGLVLSWVLVTALEGFGLTTFAVPFGTLLIQVVVAAALAVLASIRTARRAARLNVLEAIATE
jgi:putative ABC transport system permease protein